MKAAILEGQGAMRYDDVAPPAPSVGEVLLEVRASAVCGSDIHRYARGHRTLPLILGHEASGVIVGVGDGVDPALLGRHAALVPLIPDHTCDECRAGRFSACGAYTFVGSRRDGANAELVAIPAANVLLVPDGLPFEHAALIEPSTVARHLLDLGDLEAGQTAVVLGAGSIGLMLIQWLRVLGAGTIIATDVVAANREAALAMGAHRAFDPGRDPMVEAVRDLTGGGADATFEASGSPAALSQVVEVTRPRGRVVLGGNQPLDVSLPMTFIETLMRREISLIGGFMSYSAPWPGHEWTDTLGAVLDGGLDMAAMISHRAPLSAAPAIFAEVVAHRLHHRKIVFDPST